MIFNLLSLNSRFASIGPVAGSPFLGYAEVPDQPLSIIDFHGTADQTIPYWRNTSEGLGPDDTLISFDGYFYYDKPRVIRTWAEGLGCGPALPWPTPMDGVQVGLDSIAVSLFVDWLSLSNTDDQNQKQIQVTI